MEARHARSGASAQLRLGGRCRRLHPRRRARPSHAIDRQPADQAAGGGRRPGRCCTATARTCARPKPASGCCPMRGGCCRSPRRRATCCASPTAKARSGSASPRILRRTGWQNCSAPFSRSHPGLRLDVRADQSKNLARDLDRGELDLALFKREAGEKGAHCGVAGAGALGHQQEPSGRRQRLLRAADRLSARLPLSRRRHPRAGKRGPHLAHVLLRHRASPASRPRSPPAWA